jgi:hypothetical protein
MPCVAKLPGGQLCKSFTCYPHLGFKQEGSGTNSSSDDLGQQIVELDNCCANRLFIFATIRSGAGGARYHFC